MAEDKGFSYQSPEKQKKSAARLLIVEVAVLVLVVVGIVTLLQYLGFISLHEWSARDSKQADIVKVETGRITPVPTVGVAPKLIVRSENPRYTVTISDQAKERFIDLIEKWPFYGKPYNDQSQSPSSGVVDTLEVVLASQPGQSNIVRVNNAVTSSLDTSITGGSYLFRIYFSDDTISRYDEDFDDVFTSTVLNQAYRSAYFVGGEEALREGIKVTSQIYNEEKKAGREYFVIEEK